MATIELLEARIAPAGIFTYIDVDGDTVTVKTSKGTSQQLIDLLVRSSEGVPNGEELQRIDFSLNPAVFKGTDLSVTAVRNPVSGGDGRVNVGFIDATSANGGTGNLDLGHIFISGDLGRIVAGDDNTATAGLKSLTVGSMGRFGTDTQSGASPSQDSFVMGAVGKLAVRGDFKGGTFIVSGGATAANGKLGSVVIGGSLLGGDANLSGFLSASGGIASVHILHDLAGGAGAGSGQIFTGAKLGKVVIDGSLSGGGGFRSGRLQADSIGTVVIKGNLVGGSTGSVMSDDFTGCIESVGPIGTVAIGGSILGGRDPASATITSATGGITSLTVGHDIIGEGTRSASVTVFGAIQNFVVRGSIIGGFQASGSAEIEAKSGFGRVFIGGNLEGGVNSPHSGGLLAPNSRVGSILIGGSIIGGVDTDISDGGQEGEYGGTISGAFFGSITVRGSVVGRSGNFGGMIQGFGIEKISIGGSLVGGEGVVTGLLGADISVGTISIGGDLRGADASGFRIEDSGLISCASIGKITIGGSIVSGQSVSGTPISRSGFIGSSNEIGSITVKGDIVGNESNPVTIVARGKGVPSGTIDMAIRSVTVSGRVEHSSILAGYSLNSRGLNADAQIGTITVGGDWIASNVLAGINPGADGKVGTVDDVELHAGEDFGSGPVTDNNAITSRIASIVIKGAVFGTPGVTTDTFGFGAQEIVSFKMGAVTVPLKPGVANDVFASGKAQPLGAGRTGANTQNGFEVHVYEV